MNIDIILRLLKNAGFHVLGLDGISIQIEDPACILRSFETFIDYAWIAITFITGVLLFGWAIAMIRGSKNGPGNLITNMRNLILIFGILAASKPIINLIWGGDLFARGCNTIHVSISDVEKILDSRNQKLTDRRDLDYYEEFHIYDTGPAADYLDRLTFDDTPPSEIPYAASPVLAAGQAQEINVTVNSENYNPNGPTRNQRPQTQRLNTSGTVATASNNDVVYTAPDGRKYKKTGGSRAWRNNNPGNIRYSKFARSHGAIGQAGNFAVFPDEETGVNAIRALLRSKSYNTLTVGGAISKYAPPFENDTAAYHRQMEKRTGISMNMKMSQLTPDQFERVVTTIRQIEGWRPGRQVDL